MTLTLIKVALLATCVFAKPLDFRWLDEFDQDLPNPGGAGTAVPAPTDATGILIYVHGWNPDFTPVIGPTWSPDFTPCSGAPDLPCPSTPSAGSETGAWIKAGWKVGALHWEMYALEDEVQDTEAKIWTSTGPKGLRYYTQDGYRDSADDRPVPEMLYDVLKPAIQDAADSGVRIVFAGLSLGAQVIVRIATLFNEDPTITTNPFDLWLLENFYSNGGKGYLAGDWVGERIRDQVAVLQQANHRVYGTRTSMTSSTVFVGDENKDLNKMIMFIELTPYFFGSLQVAFKHRVPGPLFLRSFSGYASTNSAPTPTNTVDRRGRCWVQKDRGNSAYTIDPSDDEFGGGSAGWTIHRKWWQWWSSCQK